MMGNLKLHLQFLLIQLLFFAWKIVSFQTLIDCSLQQTLQGLISLHTHIIPLLLGQFNIGRLDRVLYFLAKLFSPFTPFRIGILHLNLTKKTITRFSLLFKNFFYENSFYIISEKYQYLRWIPAAVQDSISGIYQ